MVINFSSLINSILGRAENWMAKPKFNLFQTFWLNFRLLPFSQAIKFPIYCYGSYSIGTLNGGGRIMSSIRPGMITIGKNRDWFHSSRLRGLITMPRNTQIIFHGSCSIGNGCVIRMSGNGVLELGEETMITSGVKLCCENSIKIGRRTWITFDCQIRDTNFHYVMDSNKMTVGRKNDKIEIGANCWIGNSAVVTKGAVIPDWSLVASGSLANKNYLAQNENVNEPLFLVGTPAKIKGKGLKRIMELDKEVRIDKFFEEHPEEQSFKLQETKGFEQYL